ncbi:Mitochodrial transcription termination factor-related [Macleaya cordata]|uniref:Mitochodrial transcription termination factor-related n=1 Tax=Macleaya cordata TaxID=56857 RepID=A0A200QVX9_MACCD|nr:Mitochodrial transcription termination factor-related [Macleaya cordata]
MDLGFTPDDIADIITANPWILKRSADKQILPSITQLKEIVGTNSAICKVLKGCAWFLHHDLEKTMIPNIEFMKSSGICESQITKTLFNFPRLFTLKPETMKALVQRVDELGADRNSKMFVHAIRTLASMTRENWELKLQVFRSLGWSENDILFVFRSKPSVFTYSDKKIREVAEFISCRGKYHASFLLLHPEMLSYSLESRVKPRFQIVEILKSKNLISKSASLASICKLTDNKFLKRYVLPYKVEVGNLFKYPTS